MHEWWRPADVLRRRAIMNAACVPDDAASVDRAYVQRLLALSADFPHGARWLLYAFDQACDDHGKPRADWTTFHVPNAYAAQMSAEHPARFVWVASVHPYREDALARLDDALLARRRRAEMVAERNEHRSARSALPRHLRPARSEPACR